MRITATVHGDGSGTLSVDPAQGRAATRQDLPAADADTTRKALTELMIQHAKEVGHVIRVRAVEPTGSWDLDVTPEGAVTTAVEGSYVAEVPNIRAAAQLHPRPPAEQAPAPTEPQDTTPSPPSPTEEQAPAPTKPQDTTPSPPSPTEEQVPAPTEPQDTAEKTSSPAQPDDDSAAEPPSLRPDEPATPMTRREARERSFLNPQQASTPPVEGWRGALARLGFTVSPSPAEQARREDVRLVSRHWPGPRTIAVVNGKGGANKTPTTAMLSAVFARYGGGGVLAWDNNDTRGTLGWRTEQGHHEAHVRDLLPMVDQLMDPAARAADITAFVHHQAADKFDVLRSNPASLPGQQRLTRDDFDAVHRVASRYFRVIFIDSGNAEDAPHWLRMIDHADQIVVATTSRPEHAEAARLLLNALHVRDSRSARLADGAVVIVSQADRDEKPAAEVAAHYQGLAREAISIPYDRGMRADWLLYDQLAPETQRAWLRAAAAVAANL